MNERILRTAQSTSFGKFAASNASTVGKPSNSATLNGLLRSGLKISTGRPVLSGPESTS